MLFVKLLTGIQQSVDPRQQLIREYDFETPFDKWQLSRVGLHAGSPGEQALLAKVASQHGFGEVERYDAGALETPPKHCIRGARCGAQVEHQGGVDDKRLQARHQAIARDGMYEIRGIESCGGDPVAAAYALRQQGIVVHLIGFGLGNAADEDAASLQLDGPADWSEKVDEYLYSDFRKGWEV